MLSFDVPSGKRLVMRWSSAKVIDFCVSFSVIAKHQISLNLRLLAYISESIALVKWHFGVWWYINGRVHLPSPIKWCWLGSIQITNVCASKSNFRHKVIVLSVKFMNHVLSAAEIKTLTFSSLHFSIVISFLILFLQII